MHLIPGGSRLIRLRSYQALKRCLDYAPVARVWRSQGKRPTSCWMLLRNPAMPAYDDDGFAPAASVARVRIRHPDSGESIAEVPMLIDSGADATLLPKSALASLSIVGTGERYKLEAFDGTTNDSEAVVAVLVFLNKSFRGRFLQVDSEVGVIGRNVLNRVRLLLDGPVLKWDELPP